MSTKELLVIGGMCVAVIVAVATLLAMVLHLIDVRAGVRATNGPPLPRARMLGPLWRVLIAWLRARRRDVPRDDPCPTCTAIMSSLTARERRKLATIVHDTHTKIDELLERARLEAKQAEASCTWTTPAGRTASYRPEPVNVPLPGPGMKVRR